MEQQPTLRFQQFKDSWKVKTIKDLGTIGRGKSRHRPRNDSRLYGVEYPFVQTSDIRNAGLILNSFSQAYSEFGLNQSKLWPQGTLCITIAANIAETSILGIDACFPDSIIGFIPNSQMSNAVFVKIYFEFINPSLQKLSEGVAQSNLNLEKLSSIEFTVPSLLEQQKIASFFMLLNRKIEKQKEKIKKMEELNKGMMQKIFSQEIRFKDENSGEFPKWEEKLLNEISIINPKSESINNEFYYIDLDAVNKGIIKNLKTVFLENAPSRAQRVLKEKDVLFQTVRPYQQNHFYVKNLYDKQTVASTGFAQIRTKQNAGYIYFLIYTETFAQKVKDRCTGTSYPAINSGDLGEISVPVPSLLEQEKISACLSLIDQKINIEKVKLKMLIIQKKGFMQQMFI